MIYICFMTPSGFIDEAGFSSFDALDEFIKNNPDCKFTEPHDVPVLINDDSD